MTLYIIFTVVKFTDLNLYLAVGDFKENGLNPLSKFLSPLVSFIYGEDTISVPGIVYGTIWGSFAVPGSFAGPYRTAYFRVM